jgi:hypothetical protein
MSKGKITRQIVAKSETFNIQLNAIRLEIWALDEKISREGTLSLIDDIRYDALVEADARILKTWKTFRTKSGLSNDAIV